MSLDSNETGILVNLLARERWACLATLGADGGPLAAMVAFAPDGEDGHLLLHLSTLALHTRNLLQRPRVSLAVSEQYAGHGDPQTLARIAVQGETEAIAREHEDHGRLRDAYVTALPESEPRFGFGDFHLLRLVADEARYVGGFARAFAVDAKAFRDAVCEAARR